MKWLQIGRQAQSSMSSFATKMGTSTGRDLGRLAIANLLRRKSRMLLTMVGVIIGTACITLMVSLGWSGYTQFTQMLQQNRMLTRIELSDATVSGESGSGAGITENVLSALKAVPHVKAVSGIAEIPARIRVGEYEAQTTLLGVDPDVLNLDLEIGNMFSKDDAYPALVVGAEATKFFVDPDNPPDYRNFSIMDSYDPQINWINAQAEFSVGYTTEEDMATFQPAYQGTVWAVTKPNQGADGSRIFIPLSAAEQILMDNASLFQELGIPVRAFRQAYIQVDDLDNVPAVMEKVRRLGFDTYSESEYITQMLDEQRRQQVQLLAIGMVSLVVSAIGIANTMHAQVLERRREIGIMRVLGMTEKEVRKLFLMESGLIGICGGLLGFAVSWVIVLCINAGTMQQDLVDISSQPGAQISIPAWVAVAAVVTAAVTGVLSGIWPAGKAAKMSPLDAMRQKG